MIVSDIIIGLGNDQMSAVGQFIFPSGIPTSNKADRIALRVDTAFDPPEDSIETYDIPFKGLKYSKTSHTHGMDKTFSVECRLDQEWGVFDDLNKWLHMSLDPVTGTSLPDSAIRTDVIYQAQDGNMKGVKNIRFKGAKLKALKIGSFDPSSSDPLRVSMTFIFYDMIIA